MLSEQERRDMKDMADSAAIREEFRRLKAASQRPVPLDDYLRFLTMMSRLAPPTLPPRRLLPYPRSLL